MAAGVATSRHYVGLCISSLAAITAHPDINRPFPEGSNPAAGSFRKPASASGCPSASCDFRPRPASVVSAVHLAASFGPFHRPVAWEISSVSFRAFPWRQVKALMNVRVVPAESGARSLWITRITGVVLSGQPRQRIDAPCGWQSASVCVVPSGQCVTRSSANGV